MEITGIAAPLFDGFGGLSEMPMNVGKVGAGRFGDKRGEGCEADFRALECCPGLRQMLRRVATMARHHRGTGPPTRPAGEGEVEKQKLVDAADFHPARRHSVTRASHAERRSGGMS